MNGATFGDITGSPCHFRLDRSSDGSEWMMKLGDGTNVATVYLTDAMLGEILAVVSGATGWAPWRAATRRGCDHEVRRRGAGPRGERAGMAGGRRGGREAPLVEDGREQSDGDTGG